MDITGEYRTGADEYICTDRAVMADRRAIIDDDPTFDADISGEHTARRHEHAGGEADPRTDEGRRVDHLEERDPSAVELLSDRATTEWISDAEHSHSDTGIMELIDRVDDVET
jgi:hypothetical protein